MWLNDLFWFVTQTNAPLECEYVLVYTSTDEGVRAEDLCSVLCFIIDA